MCMKFILKLKNSKRSFPYFPFAQGSSPDSTRYTTFSNKHSQMQFLFDGLVDVMFELSQVLQYFVRILLLLSKLNCINLIEQRQVWKGPLPLRLPHLQPSGIFTTLFEAFDCFMPRTMTVCSFFCELHRKCVIKVSFFTGERKSINFINTVFRFFIPYSFPAANRCYCFHGVFFSVGSSHL